MTVYEELTESIQPSFRRATSDSSRSYVPMDFRKKEKIYRAMYADLKKELLKSEEFNDRLRKVVGEQEEERLEMEDLLQVAEERLQDEREEAAQRLIWAIRGWKRAVERNDQSDSKLAAENRKVEALKSSLEEKNEKIEELEQKVAREEEKTLRQLAVLDGYFEDLEASLEEKKQLKEALEEKTEEVASLGRKLEEKETQLEEIKENYKKLAENSDKQGEKARKIITGKAMIENYEQRLKVLERQVQLEIRQRELREAQIRLIQRANTVESATVDLDNFQLNDVE